MRLTAAETAIESGIPPALLCTLALRDGRKVRVANQAISVSTRNPGTDGPYDYAPFLAGIDEFDEELDVFALEGASALTQARVEITTTEDLVALQGDWYHVTAATVEIALIWPGQDWEDRFVLLDGGTVQSVEFGFIGEPTRFSVEATPPASSANIGDDTLDVGDDFPAPLLDNAAATLSDLAGTKYTRVYGDPESIPAFKVGNFAGNNRLLLAGHRFPNLGNVTAYADGVSVGTFAPSTATATSGVVYTYIQSATEFQAADGAYTFYARNGGIAAADDANAAAINADGVLRKLLVESALTIDWLRMENTLAKLRGWRIGFYCDAQAAAIDVIRDRILPWLPLVEVPGGEGLWFAFADPEAPIEAELIMGQNLVDHLGRMQTTDIDTVRNSFTLRYSKEEFSGDLTAVVTLDADNSALCYLSQQLFGTRAEEPQDCDVVWDEVTARKVLRARASRLALPRRLITYLAAPDAYWLRAGMTVALRDPDYGIDGQRAIVRRLARAMRPFEVELEIMDRMPWERTS